MIPSPLRQIQYGRLGGTEGSGGSTTESDCGDDRGGGNIGKNLNINTSGLCVMLSSILV